MDFTEASALAERRFNAGLSALRRTLESDLTTIREKATLLGVLSSSATRNQLFERCAKEVDRRVRTLWESYREVLEKASVPFSSELAEQVARRIRELTAEQLKEEALLYGQGTGAAPFDLESPFHDAQKGVAAEIELFVAGSLAGTNGHRVVTERDRDALTQLLGRAAFDSDLDRHAKAVTPEMPVSLVFADVDHCKKVNDKHGHPVGDAVLKEVARRMIVVADGKGEAYRVGGEEIALILPNHTEGEGLAVAERARQSVEGNPVAGLSLTASFGVAVIPGHANNPTDWLKRADEAMYDAKRSGRNLVRLTGEPAPQQVERRGRVIRKQAEPGALSDEKAEELRIEFFHSGFVLCPTDQFQLEVKDCTNIGSLGKDIYVACPVCGFHAWLRGPQRQ